MRFGVVASLLACTALARADRSAALTDLLARTDALAREVSHLRGLPLKHAIPNDVVDAKELRARLDKLASDRKTADATAAEGLALARWGMIPPPTHYTELLVGLLADQIAGYYDPDTKKLTISETAGDDANWAEMVLAHEIDHGLQDQTFDLNKFEDLPDTEGDAAIARRALVEGDGIAVMVELMYARHGKPAPWGDPLVAAELSRAMAMPAGDSLDRAPFAVRETLLFPYRAGFSFVAALRRRQPWSAVDAAFARPPKSTEQVMHLDKYESDDKPIAVTAAAPPSLAGFSIVHSTVWGELGFAVFLRSHGVGEVVAQEAAAGWGGDRAIVLARTGDTRPEHAVGIARTEWDTEVDALEAEEAAVRAVDDAVAGGVVEHTKTRTEWLGVDGTSSFVERRGSSVVIVIGAPSYAAPALATDVWPALAVATPAPKRGKK
jgi:hypothetical protein